MTEGRVALQYLLPFSKAVPDSQYALKHLTLDTNVNKVFKSLNRRGLQSPRTQTAQFTATVCKSTQK